MINELAEIGGSEDGLHTMGLEGLRAKGINPFDRQEACVFKDCCKKYKKGKRCKKCPKG